MGCAIVQRNSRLEFQIATPGLLPLFKVNNLSLLPLNFRRNNIVSCPIKLRPSRGSFDKEKCFLIFFFFLSFKLTYLWDIESLFQFPILPSIFWYKCQNIDIIWLLFESCFCHSRLSPVTAVFYHVSEDFSPFLFVFLVFQVWVVNDTSEVNDELCDTSSALSISFRKHQQVSLSSSSDLMNSRLQTDDWRVQWVMEWNLIGRVSKICNQWIKLLDFFWRSMKFPGFDFLAKVRVSTFYWDFNKNANPFHSNPFSTLSLWLEC